MRNIKFLLLLFYATILLRLIQWKLDVSRTQQRNTSSPRARLSITLTGPELRPFRVDFADHVSSYLRISYPSRIVCQSAAHACFRCRLNRLPFPSDDNRVLLLILAILCSHDDRPADGGGGAISTWLSRLDLHQNTVLIDSTTYGGPLHGFDTVTTLAFFRPRYTTCAWNLVKPLDENGTK